jgi:hypothetical protein
VVKYISLHVKYMKFILFSGRIIHWHNKILATNYICGK